VITTSTHPSSEGTQLSVYDYAPESTKQLVLLSHATGFHGRVFDPVAEHLQSNFHCYSFDYRGHGDSELPTDWKANWSGYGDDALAIARVIAAAKSSTAAPIIGAGHSMGGAALVMAALRAPELFRALVLYEPIIFPPQIRVGMTNAGVPSPLADGARRRRSTFASYDEAITNYSSKPPLNVMRPDVLRAYVMHGFRTQHDGISIKCSPEHEARTYEMGAIHETWNDLPKLRVPVWLVSGEVIPHTPGAIAALIAHEVPGSTLVQWNDLGHFGPMQDPQRFAQLISQVDAATA
jgi:pimeloyl-ACP methyl ester carboxylesterase